MKTHSLWFLKEEEVGDGSGSSAYLENSTKKETLGITPGTDFLGYE